MNPQLKLNDLPEPFLDICALADIREIDVHAYGAIITIENTQIENPFRVPQEGPPQLVLPVDDIFGPKDGLVMPSEAHVRKALDFGRNYLETSLLVHCHAGIHRSTAMSLGILAEYYGPGNEKIAAYQLQKIRPFSWPHSLIVEIADRILKRDGALAATLEYFR